MSDLRAPLSSLFAPADLARWQEKAQADLGDRPLDALRSRTADGIVIHPLYTEAIAASDPGLPGFAPGTRGATPLGAAFGGPDLRAEILEPDPSRAHALVLEAVERGATSLMIALASPTTPGFTPGVHIDDARGLGALLEGVDLARVGVHLAAGPSFARAAEDLSTLLRGSGVDPARARGGFGADAIGSLFRDGELPVSVASALEAGAVLARETAAAWPGVRSLRVDTDFVHHAGATSAQQLGCALALGVEWLRACEAQGLPPAGALSQIEFSLRLDTRFFEQIATLRAARRLWSRVGEACGASDVAMSLHAMTSERVLTRRDPWVNVLRGTATTFAALIGGADAITCASFDQALGAPGTLGRRLARNTGVILAEESHLDRVVDPAGGSWFIESLTAEIARHAWEFFQQIEARGGALAALRSRWLREQVDAAWTAREKNLRTRREAITGVSEYPDLHERTVKSSAREVDRKAPAFEAVERVEPWPVRRLADPFEALRDASDAMLTQTGHRPSVFVATLGPVAAHAARAGWINNLLAAGGIEGQSTGALDDAASAVEALRASGSTVAILCSTDAIYATEGEATAQALKASGAQLVVVAGKPGTNEPELRAAGVDRFVHLGQDVVGFLRDLHDVLGPSDREGALR